MARKSAKKASASGGGFSASGRWILVETVLLVGLGKEMLEWLVLEQSPLPPVVQVILGMVVVASTLGGLVVVAEQRLRKSLAKTHRKVQRRYRLPAILWHVLMVVFIFIAYAAFWNEETGAFDQMLRGGQQWWSRFLAWLVGSQG